LGLKGEQNDPDTQKPTGDEVGFARRYDSNDAVFAIANESSCNHLPTM
jgi:hypothetical protein